MKALGLPVVETFISHDREDVLSHLKKADFPMVWKINQGFGSLGVFLIKDLKQGKRMVNKVFSQGRTTFWGYEKQKNYVYLQTYLADCGQDIRVMAIGDRYFGMMREPDDGDFRASGAGHLVWDAVPEDALRLSREAQLKLKSDSVVIDMLRQPETGELGIIEVSLFTGAISQVALKVDGKPGCYRYHDGVFEFQEGKYWTQELTIMETMKSWAEKRGIPVDVELE